MRVLLLLLASLALASTLPSVAADLAGPRPRVVDPAKARAQKADRQRLVPKLRDDAPKLVDEPAIANPHDGPMFHRHDRR